MEDTVCSKPNVVEQLLNFTEASTCSAVIRLSAEPSVHYINQHSNGLRRTKWLIYPRCDLEPPG